MTPAAHAAYIRQLEFQLYKAEHGMGMPYSPEDVKHWRRLIDEARRAQFTAEMWMPPVLPVIDSDFNEEGH